MGTRRLPEPPQNIGQETRKYLQDLIKVINLNLQENESDKSPDIFIPFGSLVEVSTSQTIGNSSVVLADASASALSLTLLEPLSTYRKFFHVKKINTNANDVTLIVESSGTIDNSTSVLLTGSDRPSLLLYSDGTEYKIL